MRVSDYQLGVNIRALELLEREEGLDRDGRTLLENLLVLRAYRATLNVRRRTAERVDLARS